MVLNRLDHHCMLQRGISHLHAPSMPYSLMRNITVTGNLVRSIDDHDALSIVAQDAGAFTKHRRLPDTRASKQTNRLSTTHHIEDNIDRSVYRTAHTARQANDFPRAIANRRDAVQGFLDTCSIVGA